MKMLIITSCLVNYGDDRGGVGESSGSIVDVPKAAGRQLAEQNRALYLDKADDHDRAGRYTADKDMAAAAEKAAKPARTKQTDAD